MSLREELKGPPPAKLVVDHVSKWFRQKRQTVHALDDVSLEVAEGEFIVIVGPSGCGKSTSPSSRTASVGDVSGIGALPMVEHFRECDVRLETKARLAQLRAAGSGKIFSSSRRSGKIHGSKRA